MKDIKSYLYEHLDEGCCKGKNCDKKSDKKEVKKANEDAEVTNEANEGAEVTNEAEESIKSEKDFKDYAENKFKKVFGDKLDEDKMKKIIDGIIDKYGKEGNWGQAVGVLNKSFGK